MPHYSGMPAGQVQGPANMRGQAQTYRGMPPPGSQQAMPQQAIQQAPQPGFQTNAQPINQAPAMQQQMQMANAMRGQQQAPQQNYGDTGGGAYQSWMQERARMASYPEAIRNSMPQQQPYQPTAGALQQAQDTKATANYIAGGAKRASEAWGAANPDMASGQAARAAYERKKAARAASTSRPDVIQQAMTGYDAKQAGPVPGTLEWLRNIQGRSSGNAQMGQDEARRRGYI